MNVTASGGQWDPARRPELGNDSHCRRHAAVDVRQPMERHDEVHSVTYATSPMDVTASGGQWDPTERPEQGSDLHIPDLPPGGKKAYLDFGR